MNVDFQLLKRYLEGNGDENDKERILDWFSNIETEGDLRKHYKQYWDELAHKEDTIEYDGSNILGKIYHELKLEECRTKPKRNRISGFINVVTKVAAVLFIPVLAMLFVYKNNNTLGNSEIAYSEIYSPPGTRTMFYLPDGSSGWLNGGSYLEFPMEFRGKTREIALKGEAYFDVRSNSKKPFVVSGTNVEIIAYGTSFNVLAHPDDQIVKITLLEGSIEVIGKQRGTVLNRKTVKPDQMCIYDLASSSCKIVPVDAEREVLWKEGKLAFRDEPFTDVIKKINRWYNIDIVIKDEILNSYTYLATFQDETLEEVLKLIELSAPIRYRDMGRKRKPDGTFTRRKIELYYKD